MSEVVKAKPRYGVMRLVDAMQYRLPLAGWVSILHRASGLLMFVLLPFVLYLLDKSLTSVLTFAQLGELLASPFAKLVLLALIWAYLHHFSAGIRHLIMDLHYGLDKHTARKSAASVLVISLTLTALIGLKLFGVF